MSRESNVHEKKKTHYTPKNSKLVDSYRSAALGVTVELPNQSAGGNNFQTCLRPGCYWRHAFIRGIQLEAFFKFSVPVHPAPIRGRLLLETRRLLEVLRYSA